MKTITIRFMVKNALQVNSHGSTKSCSSALDKAGGDGLLFTVALFLSAIRFPFHVCIILP